MGLDCSQSSRALTDLGERRRLRKLRLTLLRWLTRLGQGREDAAITRAIIAMAHGLALKVVAEGVEDQQQLD
ncbi:EAL domain-containing protein, partial [Pseudomonas syringae]|nr:EAL domain-containing protein [Pseudomonas syringae]